MIEYILVAAGEPSETLTNAGIISSILAVSITAFFTYRSSVRASKLSKEADDKASYVTGMQSILDSHDADFKRKNEEIAQQNKDIETLRTRLHNSINREMATQGKLDMLADEHDKDREYYRGIIAEKDRQIDDLVRLNITDFREAVKKTMEAPNEKMD